MSAIEEHINTHACTNMYDLPESANIDENRGCECLLWWMGAVEVMDSESSIQIKSHPQGKSPHLGCLVHRSCSV